MSRQRKGGSKEKSRERKELVKRIGIAVGGVVVLYYLFGGGEYGTLDLIKQRSRYKTLAAEVSSLEARVDSLRTEYRLITTDRSRLEEIARERYGMVKGDKELIYYFFEDSANAAGKNITK